MRLAVLCIGLVVLSSVVGRSACGDEPALTVIDAGGKSHPISAADMAALPQQTLKAKAHGVQNEFSGVLLTDLLQSAGVEFGEKLRGARACEVVVVEAADGYRTAFALLEIDPATTDKSVLVADQKDGKPLEEKEGPLRLVVPDEKRPVRWARMVKTIRVVNLKELPLAGAGSK